jgi:polyisoprenoid-binding protein YceI
MTTSATVTTTPTVAALPTAGWRIDPSHSYAGFEVKHLGISTFRGRFTDVEGVVRTEAGQVRAIDGVVRLASVLTTDERLDGHLRSPDFFDVENHPEGRFLSTRIVSDGDALVVDGDLTLRGVTRPVRLEATLEGWGVDPAAGERISLQARGSIDRTEFGISWNSTLANGLPAVGERVTIVLGVEAVREEQEQER